MVALNRFTGNRRSVMPRCNAIVAAACLAFGTSPLLAQTASSSAYALSVDQTVTAPLSGQVNVSIGPLASSSGSAPPIYNNSNALASVNESINLTTGLTGVTETLTTGILTSNASGTGTSAQATATVNNLAFSLGTGPFLASLLGLNATTIQSFSQANSIGGLDASGMTTIEGLTLTGSALGGLAIDGSLFVNPAPNTVLFSGGGLSIILNEQTAFGDGITGTGIETNAIRIAFNDFPIGTGLKNGNVIIGNSRAFASIGQAAAVPEPSTWAMLLLGFGAIGVSLRRRRADDWLASLEPKPAAIA
jgi:hypothetical protein